MKGIWQSSIYSNENGVFLTFIDSIFCVVLFNWFSGIAGWWSTQYVRFIRWKYHFSLEVDAGMFGYWTIYSTTTALCLFHKS